MRKGIHGNCTCEYCCSVRDDEDDKDMQLEYEVHKSLGQPIFDSIKVGDCIAYYNFSYGNRHAIFTNDPEYIKSSATSEHFGVVIEKFTEKFQRLEIETQSGHPQSVRPAECHAWAVRVVPISNFGREPKLKPKPKPMEATTQSGLKLTDLVVGAKYKVVDDLSKVEGARYYADAAGKTLTLTGLVNGKTLTLRDEKQTNFKEWWLPLDGIEKSLDDKKPSKALLDMLEKLRKERYIYGYDGGPGGGTGLAIDLSEPDALLPQFKGGQEGVYLPVDHCGRFWPMANLEELFKKGETQTSFRATEYTTIRTELKLIKDKTKLPKKSSWTTGPSL